MNKETLDFINKNYDLPVRVLMTTLSREIDDNQFIGSIKSVYVEDVYTIEESICVGYDNFISFLETDYSDDMDEDYDKFAEKMERDFPPIKTLIIECY